MSQSNDEVVADRCIDVSTRWPRQFTTLIRIALPLSLSQISEMAMGITDTVLLGGIGATALAVGGLATTLFFVTLITFQSGLGGISVLIARARGEAHRFGDSRAADLSRLISTGVLFALALCLPVAAILLSTGWLLQAFGEPDKVIHLSSRFIHVLLGALLPDLVVIGLLRIVLPAFGCETLLLWTMPGMAVLNGLTNAALIHGWFGLPAMGLWGSATATVLTGWLVAGVLLFLARRQAALHRHLRLARPDWAALKKMLHLGLPMMGATGAEVAAFQVTGLRAGHFGTTSLAAHQVALSVTSTLFMISLALSQAANIRVSFWLGARRMVAARRAAAGAIILAVAWSVMSGLILLIFPHWIAAFYLRANTPDGAEAALITVKLLRIAAIYQIFDGIQVTCTAALRACHDTLVPMLVMIGSYCVLTLGFGGWLSTDGHMGVVGLWIGLAAGLMAVGIILPPRLVVMLRRQEAELLR